MCTLPTLLFYKSVSLFTLQLLVSFQVVLSWLLFIQEVVLISFRNCVLFFLTVFFPFWTAIKYKHRRTATETGRQILTRHSQILQCVDTKPLHTPLCTFPTVHFLHFFNIPHAIFFFSSSYLLYLQKLLSWWQYKV